MNPNPKPSPGTWIRALHYEPPSITDLEELCWATDVRPSTALDEEDISAFRPSRREDWR